LIYLVDLTTSAAGMKPAILLCLLQSKHFDLVRHLKLALLWNCNEKPVTTKLFCEAENFNPADRRLNSLFSLALQLDRKEFVSNFVQYGFRISIYLTKERLVELYKDSVNFNWFYYYFQKSYQVKLKCRI